MVVVVVAVFLDLVLVFLELNLDLDLVSVESPKFCLTSLRLLLELLLLVVDLLEALDELL